MLAGCKPGRGASRALTPAGRRPIGFASTQHFAVAPRFAQDYSESPDVPHHLEGHLHSSFARIAVIGLLVGAFFPVRSAQRRDGRQAVPGAAMAAAVAVTGFGRPFTLLPASVQGLLHRGLYGVTLLWLVVVAVTALRQGVETA